MNEKRKPRALWLTRTWTSMDLLPCLVECSVHIWHVSGMALLVIIDIFENRMGMGGRGGSRIFLSLVRASKTWANIVMAIQRGYRLLMSLDHFFFVFLFFFCRVIPPSINTHEQRVSRVFPPRIRQYYRFSLFSTELKNFTRRNLVDSNFSKDNDLINLQKNIFQPFYNSNLSIASTLIIPSNESEKEKECIVIEPDQIYSTTWN